MMAAAALLFVPCTALRRIHEYVIHTYLTLFFCFSCSFLPTYLSYLAYMTLTDMQLSSHQQQKNSKQQTASSVHRLPTCEVRYIVGGTSGILFGTRQNPLSQSPNIKFRVA